MGWNRCDGVVDREEKLVVGVYREEPTSLPPRDGNDTGRVKIIDLNKSS